MYKYAPAFNKYWTGILQSNYKHLKHYHDQRLLGTMLHIKSEIENDGIKVEPNKSKRIRKEKQEQVEKYPCYI